MAAEPGGEPASEPDASGMLMSSIRTAAETALPALRCLLDDKGLLPQQALGVLTLVAEIVNRLLLHINDPAALAKFRRLKLAAVHKKIARAPRHGEAILRCAGFSAAAGAEHIEWGLEGSELSALAPALAVMALIEHVQDRAKNAGVKSLSEPLEVSPALLLRLSYGSARLLEPPPRENSDGSPALAAQVGKTGGVEGALVARAWLDERWPRLSPSMQESSGLFQPGSREKACTRAVHEAVRELRSAQGLGEAARLARAPLLGDAAQFGAGLALLAFRVPDAFRRSAEPGAEPDGEPGAGAAVVPWAAMEPALHDAGHEVDQVMPEVIDSIPIFKAGMPYVCLRETLYLREFPAFFTSATSAKEFDVSLAAIISSVVTTWVEKTANGRALLSPEGLALGVGCAVDIRTDDRAMIYAIIAGTRF